RTAAGRRGRSSVSRKRERRSTGSGMNQVPTSATAIRPRSTAYGRSRGCPPARTGDQEASRARPLPADAQADIGRANVPRVRGGPREEVEEGRAGGAQRGAGREPLEAAGDEEPRRRVGEEEQDRRPGEAAERGEQDGAAADLVGDAAREEERGEHAEGVRRV